MASYTTNLNLKKPAGSENVAIGDINNNMDTIDQAYGTLNSNLTNKLNKPTTYHLNANSSVEIQLQPRSTVLVGVNSNNGTGLYAVLTYNYGGTAQEIFNTSSVSLSMSDLILTITNNVAYAFGVQVLTLWDNVNNDT